MLTQAQIDTFHRDGFLRIPKVFQGAELQALRSATDRVEADGIAGRDSHHIYAPMPDGTRQYFRSERMWERDVVFRAATVKPSLLHAIGQCQGHPFLPVNDSLVAKQPHSQTPIPWHQDPPYNNPKTTETFGIPNFDTDIYLDHSTVANGCVYGIPGKHLLGHLDLSPYAQEELFQESGAIPIEMEPGDVLFHSISAPHGSRVNPTDQKRRIFYVHYMAQLVKEHCYGGWKGKLDFTAEGLARAQSFIADRAALGWETDLGPAMTCDTQGFSWIGNPSTPPWHWRSLIAARGSEATLRERQLMPVPARSE